MKNFAKILCTSFILTLCCCIEAGASYTLQDVLVADKGISEHLPSLFIAPATGRLIKIKGNTYQVRLFSYEIEEGSPSIHIKSLKNKTFEEFIRENDLLSSLPKPGPETVNPVDYFSASPEMKKNGVNFLLSLRRVPEQP